jgi:hypothetical protein
LSAKFFKIDLTICEVKLLVSGERGIFRCLRRNNSDILGGGGDVDSLLKICEGVL